MLPIKGGGLSPVQHRTCKCGGDCQDIVCSRCFRLRAHWLNCPQGDFCQACLLVLLSCTDTPGAFRSSPKERRIFSVRAAWDRDACQGAKAANTDTKTRSHEGMTPATAAQPKLYITQLEATVKMRLLRCSSHTTLQSSCFLTKVGLSLKCSFSDWRIHTGALFKRRVL